MGRIAGRLGNQFFQVAVTSALAWDHEVEPYFPDFNHVAHDPNGYYQHHFFRCKISPPSRQISRDWTGPLYGYYPIPFEPEMRISGFLQSDKYFAHQRERLLELFAPHPDDLQTVETKYGWILSHPCSVSVHLRYYHGEKPNEVLQYDREYFAKAMNLFPPESLFVVTSDNTDFARKNIPSEGRHVVFIEGEPYSIDFWLQSLCKHNIISNSTFSWWSAWLNQNPEKIVVRPRVWMYGDYPDIGPEEWIRIDAPGMTDSLAKPSKTAQRSITGSIPTYLEMCRKAVEDPWYFENFRSLPEYAPILECGFAGESAQYLLQNASRETLGKLGLFQRLERFGNPVLQSISGIGRFSGTTLRYIVIADQITRLFHLPPRAKIAEIGAGFGGQCYILSQLCPFAIYYIYDLPPVENLIAKMMNTLSVENINLLPAEAQLPEEKIDLLISNYAFSECDRATQWTISSG